MNLKYLGDALDHWKGSAFEALQRTHLLHDFRVDAMASDSEEWEKQDHGLYAKLLRIDKHQLVTHRDTLSGNRNKYFKEIPVDGDLFLDPDTGFKTGSVKSLQQYLTPAEFLDMLKRDRIIAVYQHVRAKHTRDRVEEVLWVLRDKGSGFFCTSYESGTVALLFFGLHATRVEAIRDYFQALLGKHADKRVGYWNGN